LALPLLTIGLEAAARAVLGHKGAAHAKRLQNASSFGSQLMHNIDAHGARSDGGGLLAQLVSVLQTATAPIANTPIRRITLERALAAALAPPGTSPPQQTALEKQLTDLLSKITREVQTAGQQSRFSGEVLDANSAREIPAQQQTKDPTGTQTPGGSLAYAESILKSILQQLQSTAQQNAPLQTAQQPQAPQATVQSADVLGRMLARAAKADPSRGAAPAAPASGTAATPSDLFTRLINLIAQSSGERPGHQNGKQAQDFALAKNALPAAQHTGSTTTATSTPAFAAAINTVTATAVQTASHPATPFIDPQAVIEQVVKGIVVRNSGSSSEVRMRLQPDHLGDVSLKLTVTGSTISANIVAQNADVRDMLLSNQQQLARTLADAGLTLGNFSVDVSGGNASFSQQNSPQHAPLSKAGLLQRDFVAEDDSWADSRFGPPLLGGTKSLVLNYLA
jgi:flagellar hook-length control protein FliK